MLKTILADTAMNHICICRSPGIFPTSLSLSVADCQLDEISHFVKNSEPNFRRDSPHGPRLANKLSFDRKDHPNDNHRQ